MQSSLNILFYTFVMFTTIQVFREPLGKAKENSPLRPFECVADRVDLHVIMFEVSVF